mmetsp:Transcript_17888/g.51494  ORF Transcript_17888/g.51494 Transcript_17888/m.51494 type:complete len:264 (-) Transcript_17888:117-908(-)
MDSTRKSQWKETKTVANKRKLHASQPGSFGSSSSLSSSSSLWLDMYPAPVYTVVVWPWKSRASPSSSAATLCIFFSFGFDSNSAECVHMLKISHWMYIAPNSKATKRDIVKRSFGKLHSSVTASSEGTNNASIETASNPSAYDTALGLKACSCARIPATRKQHPVTNNRFISIAPSREDCTTFTSPARMAVTDKMISTMLPKVLFNKTPAVRPTMPSRLSVASLMSHESGTIAPKLKTKCNVGEAPAAWRPHAIGMQTKRTTR